MFKAYHNHRELLIVNCCTFTTVEIMSSEGKKPWMTALKRVGWLGFAFFLIKGLIWLAVFFFAGSELMQTCN
jgi:hypothetical protein